MLKIIVLGCFLLHSIVAPVSAQNNNYRLREPSFEEFYAELVRMRTEVGFDPEVSEADYVAAIEAQVGYVAPGLLNVTQLEQLYDLYAEAFEPSGLFLSTRFTRSELSTLWLQELIRLQLPDDAATISAKTAFGPFHVEWKRHDLAALRFGSTGYRLDVYRDDRYLQTLLLEVTEEEYHFVDLPVMPMRVDAEVIETQYGSANIWGFLEITEFSNRLQAGRLLVVMQKDSGLALVATIGYEEPSGNFPPLYNDFTFMNTTESGVPSIQHYRRLFDSWGCPLSRVDFYKFDKARGQYIQDTPERDYFLPDSVGCFLRQADEAMAVGHYAEAIDFYERTFALEERLPDPDTEPMEDLSYYQARLVLAYLLTNQPEKATLLAADIPQSENTFSQVVVETVEHNPNPAAVCQAVYDFVFANPSGFYQIDRQNTTDGIFRGAFMGSPLYLDEVACNLRALVDDVLATHTFTTAYTPLEQLAALGLTPQDYLTEDMNGDGQAEWLIWISPGIYPIFFYPFNNQYIISRYVGYQDLAFRYSDLRAPNADNRYGFVTLPGEAGRALVNLDLGVDRYGLLMCGDCGGGGPQYYCDARAYPHTARLGDLGIWRLDQGELTLAYSEYHCEDGDIAALFPNGTAELHAAATRYNDADWSIALYPAVYNWDAASRSYVLPPQPTPTPISPTATPNPVMLVSMEERPVFSYQRVDNALAAGDAAVALTMTDYEMTLTTREPSLLTYRYYRALALEALNRTDEALAEYIAVYETAPDTLLGMLAALHIEPVDNKQ